jgi:predicted kinase
MPTLIATRGIPGSGKTTYARGWVLAHRDVRRRISRDDLRHALYGVHWGLTPEEEDEVTRVQHQQVLYLLSQGFDVIVDDTNLHTERLRSLLAVAVEAGASWDIADIECDVETAIIRDFDRALAGDRHVGSQVIRAFWERYGLEDGFPLIPRPRVPETARG